MMRHGSRGGLLLLALALSCGGREAPRAKADEKAPTALGAKVARGAVLRDLRGNRRSLHDFTGHRALVVAFVGADCPVSNLYLPELVEREKAYRPKGVQFLAVYPNEGEDLDQVAAHSSDRDVPFPVLKDLGQKLADRLGVTRVPGFAVLDDTFTLRYRGRVSDRYGVGSRRAKATREDLTAALDEVLAGKKVSVPETEVDGCLLDRGRKRPARSDVTFSKHVAPILQKRCQACHRPGQAAPFALLSYADAARHGRMIKEVTTQRRMPPWHADPRYGKFANDRRLTRAEIDTIAAWVDGGMARGADRDLPRAIDWPKGWAVGKPDLVLSMPEAFEVPATGSLPYKHWIIDPKITEDRWVRMAEARPGAPEVVHHIVVYILGADGRPIPSGGSLPVLVGWAPGDLGLVCPPDTALRLPRGCRLRVEMHYTPSGKAVKDRSSFGLYFAARPPRYEYMQNEFANMEIVVPPHAPHYRAEASFRLPADARILSLLPHMHWRGKDYRYEVIHADGKRQTLLSVPRWDFNWQNVYRFREPVRLAKGARLHAVAHWDNSRNNPLNPAPEKKVAFGLQTWDEMMVGWVAYVWERPETAAELAKNPPDPADRFFDRLDTNGDGVLTPDEIPARLRPLLAATGAKLPERITRKEFKELFAKMRKRAAPAKKPADKEGASKPK
jgi:hypothetical protein